MAQLTEDAATPVIRDPAPGTVIDVAAGGAATISLSVRNTEPEPLEFGVVVRGIPTADWAATSGREVTLAARTGGLIGFQFTPPEDAPSGDLPVVVEVVCYGEVVNKPGLSLTLRVTEPVRPVSKPEPEPIPAATPPAPAPAPAATAPAQASPAPEPAEAAAPATPAEMAFEAAPLARVEGTALTSPPPTKRETKAEPKAVAPAAPPTPPTTKAPAVQPKADPPKPSAPAKASAPATPKPEPPEPVPQPPPVAAEPSVAQAKPVSAAAAPVESAAQPDHRVSRRDDPSTVTPEFIPGSAPQPVAPASPPSIPQPEPLRSTVQSGLDTGAARAKAPEPEPEVIDYAAPEEEFKPLDATPAAPQDEGPPDEKYIDDPEAETRFNLRPGETVLLRFRCENKEDRPVTYVLEPYTQDEDAILKPGWLQFVKTHANLGRNDRQYLAVRLQPPIDAEPAMYGFALVYGPETANVVPKYFVLSVSATPAVRLSCEKTTVTAGPVSNHCEFSMRVSTAGNSQTAYRISAKMPREKWDAEQKQGRVGVDDVYETDNWRYFFDEEVASLRSPAAGRPPDPHDVKLSVVDRGPWWFGFRKSHQVTVAATPVTDPTNGAKEGNRLAVTAVRWRLWPFPYWTMIPFLMLCWIIFGGQASNFRVTNGYPVGPGEWIVPASSAQSMTVALSWDGPHYPWILLERDNKKLASAMLLPGSYKDSIDVTSGQYGDVYEYEISGARPIKVLAVPLQTDNNLTLTYRTGPGPSTPVTIEKSGAGEASATIPLASSGARTVIEFHNSNNGQHLELISSEDPDPDVIAVTDAPSGALGRTDLKMDPEGETSFKAQAVGESDAVEKQELTLITSDAGDQILHLKFHVK